MIGFAEVQKIHDILIEKFGGANGIRNKNALLSALNRQYATFVAQDLYPTTIEKAATIIESIVTNHPFVAGNKRTDYVLTRLILMHDGIDILANENDKYKFVIDIARGEMDYEQIKQWTTTRVGG